MQLKIFAVSDKGCIRDHNEDMVLIGDDVFRDDARETVVNLEKKNENFFIAVADGMGGHNAGEVASEIVLQKMGEKIKSLEMNLPETQLSNRLSEWAKEIHRYILDEGNKDIERKGMGATLTGVLFYNEMAYYLNVGDSRLYRVRRGNLMQISRDHSLKEMTGNVNADANIIVNSFGGGEKIFVDFAPVGGKLLDGDILLLCSDGLSDMLIDQEIEEILGEENPVDKLLTEAKSKGGEDNISIVSVFLSFQEMKEEQSEQTNNYETTQKEDDFFELEEIPVEEETSQKPLELPATPSEIESSGEKFFGAWTFPAFGGKEVTGTVQFIETDQEAIAMSSIGRSTEEKSVPILRFSIQATDGRTIQIQYRGKRQGSMVAGEKVSVKGIERGGVLRAGTIYNHSKKAFVTFLGVYQGPCIVATVTYGSEEVQEIQILRLFRDEFLVKYSICRVFLSLYYAISCLIIPVLEKYEAFKKIIRSLIIEPLVSIVKSFYPYWRK